MTAYTPGMVLNTRNVVAGTLLDMAQTNPNIWVLTSDCGGNMKAFIERYPERFVDTGIAEQNAAGIAAGLALSGAIPFIMGMTPFVTMRCFEQNRTAIAYQNLPVRIIGWVGGMTSGGGSTHYAMEDIAIMSAIANMQVVSISDPQMCERLLRDSVHIPGPLFIRLTMAKADPIVYPPDRADFSFGKGIVIREGSDATLFTHGGMVHRAIKLADELASEGIELRLVDMWTIKPLDEALVLNCVETTKRILVWEDHFMRGGLASAIADCLIDQGVSPRKFVRVGIPQIYPGFGPYDDLLKKYRMDEEAVKATIRNIVK